MCPFNVCKKNFHCCCCDFSSTEFDTVKNHFDQHHKKKTIKISSGVILKADITDLQCKICLKSMEDISSLADHLIDTHGQPVEKTYGLGIMSYKLFKQDIFKCIHCNRICATFVGLNCHMNSHYPNIACPKCNKYFADNQRLSNHIVKGHKIEKKPDERDNALILLKYSNMCPFKYRKAFICFYCDFSASEIGPIRKHVIEHRSMIKKNELLRSILVKADITNLMCTLCFDDMKNVPSLVDHLIKKHGQPIKKLYGTGIMPFLLEGNGPYKCSICNLTFLHYLTLNTHMNSHYANSICFTCGQSFADPQKLKCHLRNVHNKKTKTAVPNSAKFVCKICTRIFSTKLERQQHSKVEHQSKDYPCSICPAVFEKCKERTKHFRVSHNITHHFVCNNCPYKCVTQAMLDKHVKKHCENTRVIPKKITKSVKGKKEIIKSKTSKKRKTASAK